MFFASFSGKARPIGGRQRGDAVFARRPAANKPGADMVESPVHGKVHGPTYRDHPMKLIVRRFFKILRIILGPFMLLRERLTQPTGLVRAPELQQAVDQQCQSLALYQFNTCPFCIKVRQEMRRLSLPIERRDAQNNLKNRADLMQGSGATKVPCLRISDETGQSRWLNDSGAIVAYLRERFEPATV
jgi:glutaredoxin